MRRVFLLLLFFSASFGYSEEYLRFRDLIHEAKYYEQQKDYPKAIEAYKQLLSLDPRNLIYLTAVANLYKEMENYEMAESYYLRLLHYYPQDIEAKMNLGEVYYKTKNYDKAKLYLTEVVNEDPERFRAVVILARIYNKESNNKAAYKYLEMAHSIDPSDDQVWKLMSSYHVRQGNHSAAYDYLFATANLTDSPELQYMMWGLRPYIYPSLKIMSSYSQERERDLVSKLMTVQLDTWMHGLDLTIPIKSNYRFINRFFFGPVRQINLVNGLNNYYLNEYNFTTGFEIYREPNFLMRVLSNQRWAQDKPPVIFSFKGKVVWEPSLSFRYASENHMFAISGAKDSIIGRNFRGETEALFVRRKILNALYEFRDSKSFSAIGIEGNIGTYQSKQSSFRKEFYTWARYDMNYAPFHMVLEYKYDFSTFNFIDPDYSSHRAEYRHNAKISFIRVWKRQGTLDAHYHFYWDKRRDFVNEAVEINQVGVVPQELKLNIYTAHVIECIGSKTIGNSLDFEMKFMYYMDSNDYRTASGKLSLKWVF